MTLERFWQLIDETRNTSKRLVEMPQALIEILCRLDEHQIVDFWSHHLDCLHRSYDARLWLAAVLLVNGCGDDKFSDFRDCLIAQGKDRFEAAIKDPDSLGDLERERFDGDYDERNIEAQMRFEALLPERKYPDLRNRNLINGDEKEARAMFPRLAARFPEGIRPEGSG
jgi:hypothetical protein